ncbi:hypothetical protein MKX03_012127 [Papaver bracteatum]|nr:hypothetical protein MKX03_012127 [Papaver bracteatum]
MHEYLPYIELISGTTVFGIKFKNGVMLVSDGFAFKTLANKEVAVKKLLDTRRLKIEEIGKPIYMLAAPSGDNVWYQPLLDSMIEKMEGKRWTAMQCGVFATEFLNQEGYEPPGNYNVEGMNLSQHSCRLVFATWEPKDNEDPNVLHPVLVRASKEKAESITNVCCIGSGEPFAQMLIGKDFSNSEKEEVIWFVEKAMIDISKKDPGTGGDITSKIVLYSFNCSLLAVEMITCLLLVEDFIMYSSFSCLLVKWR